MKKMLVSLAAAALVLTFSGAARAAEPPPSPDREADHAALRALLVDATKAFNAQDLEKLFTFFAKEFVFTTVDQTVITDLAAAKRHYERMLRQPDSRITGVSVEPSADVLTRFTGEASGYCYGKTRDTYVIRSTGRKVVTDGRWTAVVVKEEGRWKVAALHVGVNFIDNPAIAYQSLPVFRKALLGMGIGKYPGEP
jgi:ketosteroid isomerase-like protein